MKKYAGEEFLNKIYKDLANSEIVKHSGKGGNKNEDVHAYMERLERITKRSMEHDKLRLLKQAYYDKYVIKPENVPESYFKGQEQIALERGYGHVDYDEKTRRQEIKQIVDEQKSSLDSWIDYFASSDTEMYPTWFKFYCFQGMVRLGYYDKKENKYTKRTDSTVKPFIEINREAIAMVYDELVKMLNKEDVDDKKLEELLKSGSFSKIYSYCIKKLDSTKKTKSNSDEGIWKKYLRGSDPNVLFNDIHGKNTGWCTAGGLETATKHLNDGDFYVYFTKDENGQYTCPRIAIRMSHNTIAEIRGIAENQNLESNMESVVEKKLEEFPDKEKYKKKLKDMEKLTYIYTKWSINNSVELSKDELEFLYEVESKIIGFGFKEDPRIKEIINTRSRKKDLSFIFDCKEEQVSISDDEALKTDIVCHHGNLELDDITSADNITFPKIIKGSIILKNLKSIKNVKFPELINGDIDLKNLTDAEGLEFPKKINGNLYLNNFKNFKNLNLPIEVGTLFLNKITNAEGLKLPKIIRTALKLSSLTNADGLEFPERIDQTLDLGKLTKANNLKLPQVVGDLILYNLVSAKGIEFPKIIKRNLNIDKLTSAEGLILPDEIGQALNMNSLSDANGLKLPKKIGGPIHLDSLTSAERLDFPEELGGSIYLDKLTTVETMIMPQTVNGSVFLSNLKNFRELKLPEKINGTLYLHGITSIEGLIIPNELDCKLSCPLANNDINVLKQMCKEKNKIK